MKERKVREKEAKQAADSPARTVVRKNALQDLKRCQFESRYVYKPLHIFLQTFKGHFSKFQTQIRFVLSRSKINIQKNGERYF